MSLASNALTSVASFKRWRRMNSLNDEVDFLRLYHDGSGGESSATVEVTATALVLTTNLATDTLLFDTYDSLSSLVTAVDAISGWVVVQIGDSALVSSDLRPTAAVNALLLSNERYLRGVDVLLIEECINAASNDIENLCNRSFASATYRHVLDGTGARTLLLPQGPVSGVSYVAVKRDDVIRVKYAGTSTMYATVEVTSSAVRLSVDGASPTSLAFSTYTTLTTLAAAISAVSGWTATVISSRFASFPSSELCIDQPRNVLNNFLTLRVPVPEDSRFQVGTNSPILTLMDTEYQPAELAWRGSHLPRPSGYGFEVNRWPEGHRNIVVKYTAGYATIPPTVQAAANELASNYFGAGTRDTALAVQDVAGESVQPIEGGLVTDSLRRRLNAYVKEWVGYSAI